MQWLSPDVQVEGFDRLLVSNATGSARLLIWLYSLNQLVADLEVVCVGGFPLGRAAATDLALQLSGTWLGATGIYRTGEHFTTVMRVSLEFRDGLLTKVTERP